jgi:two-component system sensor histidine kinase HydH
VSALPRAADAHAAALAQLGAMTATVAHEMRNLLGGIDLYATLIAGQCAGGAVAPLAGRLVDGIARLRATTANLLAVARRPRGDADFSPVDLARIVTEVVDSAALAAPGTGIEIVTRLSVPKAPVLGDGERIRQALLNVVLNAVQAMPRGGVLTVATRRLDDVVEVRVRDTGVGMDRGTLARAFEPFFTTRPSGTGLGLAVVREVAETHGARVHVSSRPGKGTTVRLGFALVNEDAAAATPAANRRPADRAALGAGATRNRA